MYLWIVVLGIAGAFVAYADYTYKIRLRQPDAIAWSIMAVLFIIGLIAYYSFATKKRKQGKKG